MDQGRIKIYSIVCVSLSFIVIFSLTRTAWSDEVLDLRHRIRQLVEENQALERKIATMERAEKLPQEPEYMGATTFFFIVKLEK